MVGLRYVLRGVVQAARNAQALLTNAPEVLSGMVGGSLLTASRAASAGRAAASGERAE